ncbi:hypothetical protein HO173_005518 [Letharia columbiana]|uniref:Uncharacterized protein n=1 Tax=Letharia columbiana TaxID=112416 RepID=A0A8H6L5N4_9LECA|nr:uncharacterized protein HO173_005518 [Letharia columbiana]KAF6236426.1 hypothetical protein HO173_005518 [Letharia columbiana]
MFGIWLLLLFLQFYVFPLAQAASLPLPSQSEPITLTETTKLTIANHASISLTNPSNNTSVFFGNPGDPIPAAELRHTLSVARASVQAYLPRYANEPISDSFFKTNISFPETGNSVCISVYAYGFGLSWLQLSQVLVILEGYMRGRGPGHPHTHYQQLEFYVQLRAGIEVAHGVVEFAPGARAVAKRTLVTTTLLQLPHANISSLGTVALPITFHIPRTNLDLNITALGLPIPQDTMLTTIESAYTEVILDHTDIDSPMPANPPFSFTATSGKRPHQFKTEILIIPYIGKQFSWALLCIVMYGLRDFLRQTSHFNSVSFQIIDASLGKMGSGDVLYWPVNEMASTKGLKLE